jgi:CBS domain containing-hemolysin-like protein
MTNPWTGIGWFLILLILNGFFVAAEFAVITARRAQIEPRAEAGSRPARLTIRAMEQVSLMLATTQLGVTICSLLILIIAEPSVHQLLQPSLLAVGLSVSAAAAVAFVVTLVLVSFLHVVIGEVVPKNISFSVPERAALILVPALFALAQVVRPIVFSLNALANAILRIFGIKPKDEASSTYTLDQVEDIVEHSTREGVLRDTSGTLSNTFEFTEKKVKDVAVALESLVSFDETVTVREIEKAVAKHGYSRYPITGAGAEIVGYLHLKDVLDLDDKQVDQQVPAKRIRNMIALSAQMELEDALASMRRVNSHMAKVLAGDGQIRGVLFLEDILEELVGEVQDATQRD